MNLMEMAGKSKLAQMEMVGLVIIVILITLGMLFMAQFALKDSSQKKIFTRKGLAYSSMSAIMKTTVDSGERCFSGVSAFQQYRIGNDIIKDCAVNYESSPFGYSLYRCGGKHSCVFLQDQISVLLNETLGHWQKRYEFSSKLIRSSGQPVVLVAINSSKGGCAGAGERDSSGLFPISSPAGLIENVLYLCD